ncbi:MAG TPA: hypothetical protein VFK35_08565 [Candidatus Limnocylindrales bacterium]|nr:hypothetical protein [Candidatus Limnocylindrales bacterium]
MPIVIRRGRVIAEPRSRLLRFERPASTAIATMPVGIDSGQHDLRHELARLALDVVVRTAEPIDLPRRWRGFAFAREVDRTRSQLAPIRSRRALLTSFAREASIVVSAPSATVAVPDTTDGSPPPAGPPPGPVRVAYAIRWLELGDGRPRPSWAAFVAGPVEVVSAALGGEAPGAVLAAHPAQRNGEIST